MNKARTHAAAGIRKAVSEAVYPNDILCDEDVAVCELTTRGAWYEILFFLWRSGKDRIDKTVEGYSKLWRISPARAQVILTELEENGVCNVLKHEVTGRVTLVCRRLERRAKHRRATAKRVAEHRKRKCNEPVTPAYTPPSSSSSSSPSSSENNRGEDAPPVQRYKAEYDRVRILVPGGIQYEDFASLFTGSRQGIVPADVVDELCSMVRSEPKNRWEQYGPVKCLGWMIDDIAKRYRVDRSARQQAGAGESVYALQKRKEAIEQEKSRLTNKNHLSDAESKRVSDLNVRLREVNNQLAGIK